MTAKEIHFTGTPDEISAQWNAQRDKGVGGSDVGVIMNLNMWKSVEQLWAEKYGRVKPEDISHKPAIILGNANAKPLNKRNAGKRRRANATNANTGTTRSSAARKYGE